MNSNISKNDQNVLHMILNPNLPLDDDDDDNGGLNNGMSDVDPDRKFDQTLLEKVKKLEKEGVKLAEAGQIQDSVKCFDEAISCLPERASGYNNRAQLKRLNGDVDGALRDLNIAISLSADNKKVAGLAYAQRALIQKLNGNTEELRADLTMAADLGNKFAKSELVKMNPYAALCNQMLSKVIQDLQQGGATNQTNGVPNKRMRQ